MNIFRNLIEKKNISERELSDEIGISRLTLRKALKELLSVKLETLVSLASYFNRAVLIETYPKDHSPQNSAVAISLKIVIDSEPSWKIHLMNMVDEFRSTLDTRLFILPPDKDCPLRIQILIASTVEALCFESGVKTPDWIKNYKPLETPWFVSGMESLKASAILESPFSFRAKNIFVHDNFLQRI